MNLAKNWIYELNKRLTLFLCSIALTSCMAQNELPKVLKVKEIISEEVVTLSKVSELLEANTALNKVDLVNWEAFPYRPEVSFRIAHSNNQIWLKFYVTEEHILAKRTETNSATHRDSCVEFFIDPEQNGNYYNFEFNCIGVIHLAYGPNIGKRTFVDPVLIEEQIQVASTLGSVPFEERNGGHAWEMTVIIPASIFIHQSGISLKELEANANFYKCGDDTSKKHYLSWNPVKTERPNFHQPDYFGRLVFE